MSTQEVFHKCPTCSKIFERRDRLTKHIYYQHPKELVTCSTCGKQFKNKNKLDRHILIHTGEQPFACSTCNKRFNQKHRLTEHERIHSGEKPYLCPTCAQRFAYRQTFVEHLRDHAGMKHDCPVCQQEFIYLKHLNKHIKTHADEKHFSCPVCSKEFSELRAFLNHTKDHSGDKQHECQICHKKLKTIIVLQKHINDCLKINQIQLSYVAKPTKYKCRTCDKEFIEKDEFDEHVKNHMKEKALNRLNANKERFIGKKFLICDICELRCPSKNKMIEHLRVHSGERPFKCSICCKGFSYKSKVRKHKQVIHGVKLPPKRSFIFHEGRHLLVYNGKKPIPLESTKHKCHTCNKEFTERDEFDEHVKKHVKEKTLNRIKTNQERFIDRTCLICDVCDLRCASKTKMECHLRVHSGEKPSKCSICCKGFRTNGHVKKHEEKVHGVDHLPKSKIKFHEGRLVYIGKKPSKQSVCNKDEREKNHIYEADKSFPLEQSALSEKGSSLFEREPSSLEKESYPSEKEPFPSKMISFAISPERETPESEQGSNEYDHLINKLRKNDLNIVPHKVTNISTEKHTSKNQSGHIHQNVDKHVHDRISLSESKSFYVARESSQLERESFPLEREVSALEITTISSESEIPESEQNFKIYDLSKELKLDLHKLNKEEVEKHTSKKQRDNSKNQKVHLHEKETISLSEKKSSSVERLKEKYFPLEIETVATERNYPESKKDLNKSDHLIKKLNSKFPHKPSKDHESHMFGHQNVQMDEQESISLAESNCFLLAESAPLERESSSIQIESSPFEIESFLFEIESFPFEKDCSEFERECSPFERESSSLERESSPLERVSAPLNIISTAIPYKLTKDEREKRTSKEHDSSIHQNVHIHEQQRKRFLSEERESAPLEIITVSPERGNSASEHDFKKNDFSKELKLVKHELTNDKIEKHTSKEQKGHRKRHRKVLFNEQKRISLAERRTFSVERESSSSESEMSLSEIKAISAGRKTLESEKDLNKYDHLIDKLTMDVLNIVPYKVRKVETEKHTSKEDNDDKKIHEQEQISLSERKSFSVERESSPSKMKTIAQERTTPDLGKDSNKYDHLINRLWRQGLNIVPHTRSEDETRKHSSKEYFVELNSEEVENESEDDVLCFLVVLICLFFVCLYKSLRKRRR